MSFGGGLSCRNIMNVFTSYGPGLEVKIHGC